MKRDHICVGCKDSGLDLSGNDLAETMIDKVGRILVVGIVRSVMSTLLTTEADDKSSCYCSDMSTGVMWCRSS